MSVWTIREEKLVWFCNMKIIAAWISCADLRVQVSGVHTVHTGNRIALLTPQLGIKVQYTGNHHNFCDPDICVIIRYSDVCAEMGYCDSAITPGLLR